MAQDQQSTGQPATKEETSPESSQRERGMARSQQSLPERSRRGSIANPFSLLRRFSEDVDRFFDGFMGFGRSDWPSWPDDLMSSTKWPQLEVSREGNKLIIQADIPGIKKEDVKIDLRENELCISGERRSETQRNEGGYYQSERSYGSFRRTVPLPRGVKPDGASATFENGVLRIELEAPPEGAQGRRIEVR
jgi:HSP20 family protein